MHRRFFGIMVLVLLLVGCDDVLPPEPTPTRDIDPFPSLAPSPIVYPVLPDATDDFVGRSNPTTAALAAEGQPTEEASPAALPTQPSIPITVIAVDGILLHSTFYGAPQPPASAILLAHGAAGDLAPLQNLALSLQAVNYHALLLELRGYGASSGGRDPARTAEDILSALRTLGGLPNVTLTAIIAQGESAAAALTACGQWAACRTVVALNPLEGGSPLPETLVPLLVLVGEDQSASLGVAQALISRALGEKQLLIFPVLALDQALGLDPLVAWLKTRV
jgi:pimeloyl-ACP methyl ester carboxylesterase